MAEPEPGGRKASGFLSIALNKCGKIRNKCKLSLVVVLLVCRKKKKKKNTQKSKFSFIFYYKCEERARLFDKIMLILCLILYFPNDVHYSDVTFKCLLITFLTVFASSFLVLKDKTATVSFSCLLIF